MTSGAVAVARVGELVGGKYRIVRLLAQGGMGVVYEAQHTVVRRRFAVKFMRRDLAERRDILTRFQREAEAAGALESEHVAAAVDFGIAEDGAPYIVMEYLVGESLTALLGREGPLPVGRAADLVSQAGRGMEVAHAAGIIHRDLKPQNLFVCRRQDGTDLLKVLDFGVAKLQTLDEMSMATRTGAVVGTVAYMSPEQARGDKVVDQRSDVYALGAILYELCSGRKPHPGESHNAILHHIATQPAVPLESVAPALPVGFLAIVASALAADPGGASGVGGGAGGGAGAVRQPRGLAGPQARRLGRGARLADAGVAGRGGRARSRAASNRRAGHSGVGRRVVSGSSSGVGARGRRGPRGAGRRPAEADRRCRMRRTLRPRSLRSRRASNFRRRRARPSRRTWRPLRPLHRRLSRSCGAGGSAVAHPARRHAARPAPARAASSAAPPAPGRHASVRACHLRSAEPLRIR